MQWITRLSFCALLGAGAGCTRWEPAALPEGPRPVHHARVTTVGNAVFVLRGVQVTADSVTGWHEITTAPLQTPNRQRIALHRSQVRRFDEGKPDVIRTGLGAFLAACGASLFYAFTRGP